MSDSDDTRARALELVDDWLQYQRIPGRLRADYGQAVRERVFKHLPRFDPDKAKLVTFVTRHAEGALADARRAEGSGMIGTRRGQSMAVSGSLEHDDERGDSILAYTVDAAPGRDIDDSVRGSDFEPVTEITPQTASLPPSDKLSADAREAPAANRRFAREQRTSSRPNDKPSADAREAPAANRRFAREVRIHIFRDQRNATERLLAAAQDHRLTVDQAEAALSDFDFRRDIYRPQSVPNPGGPDPSPIVLKAARQARSPSAYSQLRLHDMAEMLLRRLTEMQLGNEPERWQLNSRLADFGTFLTDAFPDRKSRRDALAVWLRQVESVIEQSRRARETEPD